jgi:hypothetical protein
MLRNLVGACHATAEDVAVFKTLREKARAELETYRAAGILSPDEDRVLRWAVSRGTSESHEEMIEFFATIHPGEEPYGRTWALWSACDLRLEAITVADDVARRSKVGA